MKINQVIKTEVTTDTYPLNINVENIEQGFTQENYGEFQTSNIPTELDTQNVINTEMNTTETQNSINYETGQIDGDTNFKNQEIKVNEIDSLKNKGEELQSLNSKLDELIGLKSQIEEINNLKVQVNQINLNKQQNEELNNNQDIEKESLKIKIKETEDLIEQYKKELFHPAFLINQVQTQNLRNIFQYLQESNQSL